jgi:hypothetical protein
VSRQAESANQSGICEAAGLRLGGKCEGLSTMTNRSSDRLVHRKQDPSRFVRTDCISPARFFRSAATRLCSMPLRPASVPVASSLPFLPGKGLSFCQSLKSLKSCCRHRLEAVPCDRPFPAMLRTQARIRPARRRERCNFHQKEVCRVRKPLASSVRTYS